MNRLSVSIPVVLLTAGLTVGCSSHDTKESAPDAIASAKTAMEKADGVGYLWRDTGKLLGQAEEASEKGESDKAIALAGQAEAQANDAYEQYERYYESAGPRF